MGSLYCRTTTRKECSLTATSRTTSRHDAHDVVGPHVCLVACLEADMEKSVQQCSHCQEQQPVPPVSPLQPWKWPSRPWVRLHMDFAGPLEGKMILVVIDSHTTWIEAYSTDSTASSKVIELSRTLFAQFGIPEVVVTGSGAGFVSEEFETYLTRNGVKHITSAPYHPSTKKGA